MIGAPLVLAAVYYGGWLNLGFVAVAVLLGLVEFYRMLAEKGFRPHYLLGFAGATLFIAGAYVRPDQGLAGLGVLVMLAMAVLVQVRYGNTYTVPDLLASLAGAVYVGLMFSFLVALRQQGMGPWPAMVAVLGTWSCDIAGYFVGVGLGRHRIYPRLSPNKTLEGAIGGILASVILCLALARWTGIGAWQAAVTGVLIAVFAQLGDLFESAIKRYSQVKDSGTMIPGHGGVLDRFDSLLFVAPLVYYALGLFAARG